MLRKDILKVYFKGQAGQGIRLLAHSLSKILIHLDFEVSVYVNYGASVGAGELFAELIVSHKKVEVPYVEHPDLEVLFEKGGEDKATIKNHVEETVERMNIGRYAAEDLKNRRTANMIVLGKLLKMLGVDIKKVTMDKILPEKFFDDNVRAINFGYELLSREHKG